MELIVLPGHGQSSILSDKPLNKLDVAASLFFCSESRSVACARQRRAAICCSSQLRPPLQLLHFCQSTSEFFVIKSTSDIVLLQIGRVLISDDKSAFGHCAQRMSNTNVARLLLFGASDALAGFPSHHLKHAESPHC